MTGCLSETSEDYSGRRGVTSNIPTQNTGRGGQFGNRYQKSEWNKMWRETIRGGYLSSNLTEEQENEIAENIYDWWISGKSYKQWYAEKFLQTKLDF